MVIDVPLPLVSLELPILLARLLAAPEAPLRASAPPPQPAPGARRPPAARPARRLPGPDLVEGPPPATPAPDLDWALASRLPGCDIDSPWPNPTPRLGGADVDSPWASPPRPQGSDIESPWPNARSGLPGFDVDSAWATEKARLPGPDFDSPRPALAPNDRDAARPVRLPRFDLDGASLPGSIQVEPAGQAVEGRAPRFDLGAPADEGVGPAPLRLPRFDLGPAPTPR